MKEAFQRTSIVSPHVAAMISNPMLFSYLNVAWFETVENGVIGSFIYST